MTSRRALKFGPREFAAPTDQVSHLLLRCSTVLCYSTPRTPANPTVQTIIGAISCDKSVEPPNIPFAKMPHGLASDIRLSPTDRVVAAALLFWACDKATADMANKSLASYVGVSIPTIERSVKALVHLGYITTETVKPTAANMTGRVVRLRWVEDPFVLPAPPTRSARPSIKTATKSGRGSITSDGASAVEGPSPVMDPVHHGRGGGSITRDGEGPSPVMDKEDRCRKKVKNWKNAGTKGESIERQRPQANIKASPDVPVDRPANPSDPDQIQPEPTLDTVEKPPLAPLPAHPEPPPLARTLDRAMVDIQQAASMADEPINAGPGDLLTAGQRQALTTMTKAEREAFEQKSSGMRSQILAPFARGFDSQVFERIARPMLVIPRFVAERRPVDRSTPGLVAAVAEGDPRLVIDLAESLCRDLGGAGDRRRWGALHALAKQVLDRSVSAETVLDAYRQAMGPRAENPGAVFTTALKRAGWRPQPLARK